MTDVCRLCLELITPHIHKEILNTLAFQRLIKPLLKSSFFSQDYISSLSILENCLICETCFNDIKIAIKLNTNLNWTKKRLRSAQMDLGCKTVKLEWLSQFKTIPKTSSVCTVCFQIVSSNVISLNKNSSSELPNLHLLVRKMLLHCSLNVPRMVLDPIICSECWSNLQIVYKLKKTIDEVQNRIKLFCQQNSKSYARNRDLFAIATINSSKNKPTNCEDKIGMISRVKDEEIDIIDGGLDLTAIDIEGEEESSDVEVDIGITQNDSFSNYSDSERSSKISYMPVNTTRGFIQNYLEGDTSKSIHYSKPIDSSKSTQRFDFDRKTKTCSWVDFFKPKRDILKWYRCGYCGYKINNIRIFHQHVHYHNLQKQGLSKKKVHDEVIIDYVNEDNDELNLDTPVLCDNILIEDLEHVIGVKREHFIQQIQHENLTSCNNTLHCDVDLESGLRKSQRANRPLNSYKEPSFKELFGSMRRKSKSQYSLFAKAKTSRLSTSATYTKGNYSIISKNNVLNGNTNRKGTQSKNIQSTKSSKRPVNVFKNVQASGVTNRNYRNKTCKPRMKTISKQDLNKNNNLVDLNLQDDQSISVAAVELSSDDSFVEDCYGIENNDDLPIKEEVVLTQADLSAPQESDLVNPNREHQLNEKIIHIDSDSVQEEPKHTSTNDKRPLQEYLEYKLQEVKRFVRNPINRRRFDPFRTCIEIKFKRKTVFRCPLCNLTACSDESVYRHMVAHKRGLIEVYRCTKCPYKIYSYALLQEHISDCLSPQNIDVVVIDDDNEDNVVTITESDICDESETDENTIDIMDSRDCQANDTDNIISDHYSLSDCNNEDMMDIAEVASSAEKENNVNASVNFSTARSIESEHNTDRDVDIYFNETNSQIGDGPLAVNLEKNSNYRYFVQKSNEICMKKIGPTSDILEDGESAKKVKKKRTIIRDLNEFTVKEYVLKTVKNNGSINSTPQSGKGPLPVNLEKNSNHKSFIQKSNEICMKKSALTSDNITTSLGDYSFVEETSKKVPKDVTIADLINFTVKECLLETEKNNEIINSNSQTDDGLLAVNFEKNSNHKSLVQKSNEVCMKKTAPTSDNIPSFGDNSVSGESSKKVQKYETLILQNLNGFTLKECLVETKKNNEMLNSIAQSSNSNHKSVVRKSNEISQEKPALISDITTSIGGSSVNGERSKKIQKNGASDMVEFTIKKCLLETEKNKGSIDSCTAIGNELHIGQEANETEENGKTTAGTVVTTCEESPVSRINLYPDDLHRPQESDHASNDHVPSHSEFGGIESKELIHIMKELKDCIDVSLQ